MTSRLQKEYQIHLAKAHHTFQKLKSSSKKTWEKLIFKSSQKSLLSSSSTLIALDDSEIVLKEPDFLPGLDSSYSQIIFQSLDAKTLCKCGQVSRCWRQQSHAQLLWARLCILDDVPVGPEMDHLLKQCNWDYGLWWKTIYIKSRIQQLNWTRCRYHLERRRLFRNDEITCFQYNTERLMIGTKAGQLKIMPLVDKSWTDAEDTLPIDSSSAITNICFSPKSNWMATSDQQGLITLWDLTMGESLATINEPTNRGISSLLFMGNNYLLASGFDRKVYIYLVQKGMMSTMPLERTQTRDSQKKSPSKRSSLVPDSSSATLVETYDLTFIKALQGHSDDLYCMTSCQDTQIATGSMDRSIKIWDLESFKCQSTLLGHSDTILCLCHHKKYLFSGSMDKSIRRWDLETNTCDATLLGHEGWIKVLGIQRDWLISGGWDETVFIWNLFNLTLHARVSISSGPVACLQTDDQKIVVSCRGKDHENELIVLNFGMDFKLHRFWFFGDC